MSREEFTISKEEAIAMLDVQDGRVHTFLNGSFGLIGADHDLDSVLTDIQNAHHCERAGGMAAKMGHELVIFPKEECRQSDLLFVATKQTHNANYRNKMRDGE